MTLLGAKRPGAWRPRDVILAGNLRGTACRQLLRISGIANQRPLLLLLQALLLLSCQHLVPPFSLQLATVLQRYCVSELLCYRITAYCIITLLHSWARPQNAWTASLCDSALSELTGFVGAFHIRVPVRL